MDKRLLLAVVLCMGILFVWAKLFPPGVPPGGPASGPATATQQDSGTSSAASPASPAPATAAPGPGAAPARPTAAEELITLESDAASFVLSSWGGTLRHVN